MLTILILDSSRPTRAPSMYQALSIESARAIGRPVCKTEVTHIYDENMQPIETMEFASPVPCCILTGRPFQPGETDMAGNIMVPA